MTPTHTDSPLRRSEIGVFKAPVQLPIINDDDEERRQARRRTLMNDSVASTTVEDNETLKNCLKIYSENKLSKDNAWSLSLIDTLSTLLERHHKSLNNFKVAGSSLEASSKVYGLRVDSIHTDVVRMSAGFGKQKVVAELDSSRNNFDQDNQEGVKLHQEEVLRTKRKRVRKQVSTITKNNDTINSRLDTNPFTDPIFAKLNSIVGSINSSNRLLQNILFSLNSELRLRMDFNFWNTMDISSEIIFCKDSSYSECQSLECGKFALIAFYENNLRPNHSCYIITDKPAEQNEEQKIDNMSEPIVRNIENSQIAMAFDIHGTLDPILSNTPTFVDVDLGDLDELTSEEQIAINKCKGLRRAPVMIEDMRPIDSHSSHLEYSYRPMDKISQFWAGPSHWKFKKNRNKSITIAQRLIQSNPNTRVLNNRRKANKIPQHIQFSEPYGNLFQKLDEKSKLRKLNPQKKWDGKKLKLPTDLQIDHNIFYVYCYAPGIKVLAEIEDSVSPDLNITTGYNYKNLADQEYCSNIQNDDDYVDADINTCISDPNNDEYFKDTVVEIATDFAGAPDKIIKIVVPFAKRAKVVDMKQLKKCCMQLLQKQFLEVSTNSIIPEVGISAEEVYKTGSATFKTMYANLPKILTSTMADALSTSIAFYSILHLANDSNLRLFQNENLNDFNIRQLDI